MEEEVEEHTSSPPAPQRSLLEDSAPTVKVANTDSALASGSSLESVIPTLPIQAAAMASGTTRASSQWNASRWCQSLSVNEIVASVLLRPAHSAGHDSDGEFEYVRALGRSASRDTVEELLRCSSLCTLLADCLWQGMQRLMSIAATGEELHSKFLQEFDSFTLGFGSLSTFFSGLDGLIVPPSPYLAETMQREHCNATDSSSQFIANNYGTKTCSLVEYYFVADPEGGRQRLPELGLPDWPSEECLLKERCRKPLPPQPFVRHWVASTCPCIAWRASHSVPRSSSARGCTPPTTTTTTTTHTHTPHTHTHIHTQSATHAHRYTGPMFMKYNAVLRALSGEAFLVSQYEEYCQVSLPALSCSLFLSNVCARARARACVCA